MSFLTEYGTMWGVLPATTGRMFFVAPSATYTIAGNSFSASDNNDGLHPERALLTIAAAITKVTANADDVVVLLPGDHTVASASLALSKARMTLTGLPSGAGNYVRPRTTITTSVTGDQIANVTAANIEISHLRIIPITAAAAIDLSAAADNFYIHDCSFDLATPAASTSTLGIDAIGAASNVLIERIYVECDGAQGAAIDVTGLVDSVIRDFQMHLSAGTWAAAITVGAATSRVLIQDGFIGGVGTAITAGISGTGATIAAGVQINRVAFGSICTVPIDNFDAGEANINLCYKMGVGATDGGTLITAIT